MDHSNKHRSRKNHKARKAPKVPIKTYRWEDIRRARRRGGYPWTHLYKGPFTEKVNPEQFTMDAFRRAKSSSPMGRIDISEVSSWADYSGKTTPTLLQELISEPQENVSARSSRPGSVVIEEYVEDDLEDDVQVKEFQAESAESSDNISQYLDKEEGSDKKESFKNSKDNSDESENTPKSEEIVQKKRKLSAESSHSRYSFSNLGVVKKLQEAKMKIKMPKISFPTKKTAKKRSSPPKDQKPKSVKKSVETTRLRKDSKPVYIHIPLKPPLGETDEFSYLESEPKSSQTETDIEKKDETVEDKNKSPFSTLESGPKVTRKPPLKINPAFKQMLKDVRQLKDKEQASSHEEAIISKKFVDEPSKTEDLEESQTSNDESPKEDVFDQLFQASSNTKPIRQEASGSSRNVRSKSVEPPSKRRSSLESSYSRKSLSKLGIMKKLKDVSEKIKGAFSMDNLKKKDSKNEEQTEEKPKPKKPKSSSVVKAGQLENPKPTEPVYIHIPLKPPEGETDEFSYLENESLVSKSTDVKKEERTDSLDSTSPKNGDIQFIFLTPPSDDEILEKEPDIPETPSSSDEVVCFSSLKKLAQDAVDQVSPGTTAKSLETVREESVSDKGSNMEVESIAEKTEDVTQTEPLEESQASFELQEKMVVDIEDGLSETPKTEEHLKSALKNNETTSPVKKVSFKRKSRKPKEKEKDNGYETIEILPKEGTAGDIKKDANEELQTDITLPMEVAEKIIETPFLEEDYNKWQTGDHEYEPISPPSEVSVMMSSTLPNVTLMDSDTDPKIVISATEILDEPLEGKKKPFFQLGIFHKNDKAKLQERKNSSDTQSRSSQTKDLQEIQEEEQAKPSAERNNKIQAVFRQGTEQLKTKTNELRNKIHNIHLPKAPEFKKPQFKRPKLNLHLPKIPDTATIHLPHISLPGTRKTTETRTIESRQFSTESNAGDSEQQSKRHKFGLSFGGTFPRFNKSKKPEQTVVFATVPRTKNGKSKKEIVVSSEGSGSIRVPLHSDDSMDTDYRPEFEPETESARTGYEDRETSIDIARLPGHGFSEELGLEVEYERENQAINQADYLSRWQRGNFKERPDGEDSEEERIVGQLIEQRFGRNGQATYGSKLPETLEERFRSDEVRPAYVEYEEEEFDIRLMQNKHMVTDLDNLEDDRTPQNKDGYSSEGSGSLHRKGRLGKLDIDSDEFFVVHEIREGFQTPNNALAQMNEYDPIGSNRSLPMQMLEKREPQEEKTERKTIKKPKRKKTPHVSREEIPGDEESLEDVITPSRPKRRSKKNKKKVDSFVPYQETVPSEPDGIPYGQRLAFPRESLGILGDDEQDDRDLENDQIEGKEHPNIVVADPYKQFLDYAPQVIERQFKKNEEPNVPPRKNRSLKSLTQSENESIFMDVVTSVEKQIQSDPPKRPSRRSRSHTSSLSRISLPPSPRDTDSILTDEGYLADNQQIPSYLIENRVYKAQQAVEQERQPCVEEPCVQDLRDYMGYAIVDKSKIRDPPLPPPRTPPRRRKREINPDQKFATVPRTVGMTQAEMPPVRPLRNYSTLSHVRNGRKESASSYEYYKENKENEIHDVDEDVNKDLVSGEIVQKMRQRPLPAPPRPPRKPKTTRKSLQDITSRENILQEETVSTQTEPLPPDFICEEIRQEPTDMIISPRVPEAKPIDTEVQQFNIYDPRKFESNRKEPLNKRELITPSVYSFEETVTHGTLLVQPIDGAKVIPDHQLSRERLIPISKAEDNKSEIPESFRQLESLEREPDVLMPKNKLQVTDLDVDRLTVNQLLASKIVVSDIDAATISVNEIQGAHGPIKLGDVELSSQLFEQLVSHLEVHKPETKEHSEEQKKTPIFDPSHAEQPLNDLEDLQHEQLLDRLESLQNHSESEVAQREPSVEATRPPVPPPRNCTTLDETAPDAPPRIKSKRDSVSLPTERVEMLEPDIDDQPPPRPPEPFEALYLPSQPPASFYALRARQFVDENIPTAPKRKRHHSTRSRPVSRSRSTSDDSSSAPHRPARLPRRFSDSSISELSGRLIRACGTRINNTLKRLIYYLTENLLRNVDGNQDLHVFMIILLVLIAGLILLGYGEDRTVVHLHHWEYFNPPKDI